MSVDGPGGPLALLAGLRYRGPCLTWRRPPVPQVPERPWVEQWLSAPRFGRYLTACSGDRERALATYEWNLALGQAMMRDIAHFEVALRNAYDAVITERWQGAAHWLLDPTSPALAPLWHATHGRRSDANAHNRDSVAVAVGRCGGASARPDAVLAELPLGFWRHLTDGAHEKVLWVPYLHHAWPKKTSRQHIDQVTKVINATRNRVAHHEPIADSPVLGVGAAAVQADLVSVLRLLLPDLGDYVDQTPTVAAVLAQRP